MCEIVKLEYEEQTNGKLGGGMMLVMENYVAVKKRVEFSEGMAQIMDRQISVKEGKKRDIAAANVPPKTKP